MADLKPVVRQLKVLERRVADADRRRPSGPHDIVKVADQSGYAIVSTHVHCYLMVMNLSTLSKWVHKHRYEISAFISIGAHLLAFGTLIVAGTPRGYESFDEAHGLLGTAAVVVGYFLFFAGNTAGQRKFGLGLAFGAVIASIAPEHTLAGLVGLAFMGLGLAVLFWHPDTEQKRSAD